MIFVQHQNEYSKRAIGCHTLQLYLPLSHRPEANILRKNKMTLPNFIFSGKPAKRSGFGLRATIGAALISASIFSQPALALHCGVPGAYTAVQTADGQRVIVLLSREPGDVMFAFTGSDLHNDTDMPSGNRLQVVLDGLHYSYFEVLKSEFLKPDEATLDDATVLARHAEWERLSLTKAHGPLSEFADMGNRTRDAHGANSAYTFKAWQMQEPEHHERIRQVFVTTVSGDRVIVLSAIATNQAEWTRVMSAMSMYSNSYALIPEKNGCPKLPEKHVQ